MYLHARYWNYDGCDSEVKDRVIYDPHNFGLRLIILAIYFIKEGEIEGEIVTHRPDYAGHEITVKAYQREWDKVAKLSTQGEYALWLR